LNARDKEDNPVGFITLVPESVQAHVDVKQLGGFRDVAVKVVVRARSRRAIASATSP